MLLSIVSFIRWLHHHVFLQFSSQVMLHVASPKRQVLLYFYNLKSAYESFINKLWVEYSPGSMAYSQCLDWENLEIRASVCREICTTALSSVNTALSNLGRLVVVIQFALILCLFCVSLVHVCIAYWLLLYSVHDSYIQYK